MEASPLPTTSIENWAEQFDQALCAQRDRVREFLTAQQKRLRHAEDTLGEQLEGLARALAASRAETHKARQDVEHRREQVAREVETLEALRREITQRREEWEQLQQQSGEQHRALVEQIAHQREDLDRRFGELESRRRELDGLRSEIEAAEAQLKHQRQELDLKRQQHRAEQEQLDALRKSVEARETELKQREEGLSERARETERQRRRIARELKDRHTAQLREIERRRAELERRDAAEQDELRRELQAAADRESGLRAELDELRRVRADLERQQAEQAAANDNRERIEALEAERETLVARLAEAEQRLAEAGRPPSDAPAAEGAEADDEYRRRYEMAMEDLHELKRENAKLKEEVGRRSSGGPPSEAARSGPLDWEAQKQRILAALSDDFDEEDEEDRQERLKIEEVVQRTDAVVAEKDREIAELRRLLEEQSGRAGEMAIGAAAVGEILDADAVVQEERENLRQLQEQWREKLRQAEIDISVERAKLARQRMEIEEKARSLEAQTPPESTEGDTGWPAAKPDRGRWLRRLGLSGDEKG